MKYTVHGVLGIFQFRPINCAASRRPRLCAFQICTQVGTATEDGVDLSVWEASGTLPRKSLWTRAATFWRPPTSG